MAGRNDLPSWARKSQPQQQGHDPNLPSWANSGSGSSVQTSTSAGGIPTDQNATVKPKHHGGFLSDLKHIQDPFHWLGQKTERAATDLKNVPAGAYGLAKGEAQAVAQTVKHPWVTGKEKQRLLHDYSHPLATQQAKVDKPVAASVQGQVRGTVDLIRYPGRDPFMTALTVLPLLSGVARGAEIARGADITAPRSLAAGDAQVSLIRSRGALGRAAQNVYDRQVQKALTKNEAGQATGRVSSRLAAHGQKRVGGALDEEARLQQRMRNVAAGMLEKSASKLSKLPKARREEQAALELTSTQTTPAEAAAYHEAQVGKGVGAVRNQAMADLYRRVAARDLVHLDESRPAGEKVFVNPQHEQLAATDKALARVQTEGDKILVAKGVRPGEALQERVNAPGRIRAGATYEKPTAAKIGKLTPGLKRAQVRVASLEGRVARSQNGRSLTVPEARAKLASLEAEHNAALDKIAASQYGPINKADVAARNIENARAARQQSSNAGGASGRKSIMRGTVTDERRAQVEQMVENTIVKNPDHPIAARWRQRTQQIDQLRNALNPDLGEKIHRRQLGPLGEPTNPARHQNLQGALAVARSDLTTAEKRAASLQMPTGIVGGESARPGRGFVSEQVSEKKLSKAEASASRGPVVGAAQSPIGAKTYTGRALEHGFRPADVTASASRHFRQIQKFVNTDARRRAALRTGSTVRRSTRDILVREPDVAAEKIPANILQAVGKEVSATDNLDELAGRGQAAAEGLRAAHEMFRQRILDQAETSRAAQIGAEAPKGYKWVDQNALGDLAKPGPGPRGAVARKIDTLNSTVTAATVYFKVGHLGTRFLTNAATNIIQGSAAPKGIGESFRLWGDLSDEEKARALAAAGQHGFDSMPHEGVSRAARAATVGARWWATHADAPFRFNALAHELRKIGVTSPDEFRAALDHIESGGQGMPAHAWSQLSAAVRRSDREAISYDRLSPFEWRYITRGVWFYPWIKGASLFAARTAIEHPAKTFVGGQLANQAVQRQQQQLGDLPSYERGLIALSGGPHPLVTDLSTFSPFSTPADVLNTASVGQASGFANPAIGSLLQLAMRQNAYGQHTNKPLGDAVSTLFSPTPEAQILSAYLNRHKNQRTHMFAKTPLGMLARAAAGPATPRRINLSAAHKAAARERSGR